MDVTQPAYEIVIESLVLEGFAPADRERIAEGLERELVQTFSARPPRFDASAEIAQLTPAPVQLRANASPQTVGADIGRAVLGGLIP